MGDTCDYSDKQVWEFSNNKLIITDDRFIDGTPACLGLSTQRDGGDNGIIIFSNCTDEESFAGTWEYDANTGAISGSNSEFPNKRCLVASCWNCARIYHSDCDGSEEQRWW